MNDSTVIPNDGSEIHHAAFHPRRVRHSVAGSKKAWKATVAEAVVGQPLFVFGLSLMLSPALLRFMPLAGGSVIEIVGANGTNKTVLQKIAASVVGDVGAHSHQRCWHTLDEVIEDFGGTLEYFRHHPLVIDGAGGFLVTADQKKRRAAFRALAYDVRASSSGTAILISGTQSLRSVAQPSETEASNLCTLLIPDDAPHGVFEKIPSKYATASEYSNALLTAVAANHGHPYRRFVTKVVERSSKNPVAFQRKIDGYFSEFLSKVNLVHPKIKDNQTVNNFAAIYAVGEMAVYLDVLPKKFDCLGAVLKAYSLHLQCVNDGSSFLKHLEELLRSDGILQVARGEQGALQPDDINSAIGVLKLLPHKQQLWVREQNILKAFPAWHRIKNHDDVRRILKTDGRNLKVWGTLAPGMPRERLYCFEFIDL